MGEIHPIHPSATNDSILINTSPALLNTAISYWMQHDNRASVFDLAGKYLYDIGKQGGGPDEFSRISGLEPHDHLIYIKDSPNPNKGIRLAREIPQTIQIPDKNIRGILSTP